jgi:hypothetical protein
VAETEVARKIAHVSCPEGFTNLALRLCHVEGSTLARGNAGRILPAVLEERECVVNLLIDGCGGNDSDDAAHDRRFPFHEWPPLDDNPILSYGARDTVSRLWAWQAATRMRKPV